MLGAEREDARHDARQAERHRRAQLEEPVERGATADGLGVVDVAEDPEAALVVAPAGGRDGHPPRRADMSGVRSSTSSAAICRLTAAAEIAELLGRGREAPRFDHPDVGRHLVEQVHAATLVDS